MVQKSRIQFYKCKEFRHVARECQKPKRAKNAAYHREKMLLCKQEEAGIQLNVEQADWKDDTDDESDDQELEAPYMYMAKIQEVSPDAIDSGPIFDTELDKKSEDMNYDSEQIDQNYEDADLAKELEKLNSELEDFINKNKSLTEANNKLFKENDLLFADFMKSKAELKRRDSIEFQKQKQKFNRSKQQTVSGK
nr:hypothetical protein [Tanacetum cinerariifolium]